MAGNHGGPRGCPRRGELFQCAAMYFSSSRQRITSFKLQQNTEEGGCGVSQEFTSAVARIRPELTVRFFAFMAGHVDTLVEAGDSEAAQTVDTMCGKLMFLADSAFGECIDDEAVPDTTLPSVGREDGDNSATVDAEGKLTVAAQRQIAQRYEAMSLTFAKEGEERAAALTHESKVMKRNAVTEIVGRAEVGQRCA